MTGQRRRFKPTQSLKQRLLDRVRNLRQEASLLPPGARQDDLLRQTRQADTAAHMDEWLRSPGGQPPK
jgi:hypothetical protein